MARQNRGPFYDRDRWDEEENREQSRRDYGRREGHRSWWDRTGDEVRSWFGDEDAERRRHRDESRYRDEPDWGSERNMPRDMRRPRSSEYPPYYGHDYGRASGREYDVSYAPGYERYGMESEDWRHMDDYWNRMYDDNYPRDRETGRTRYRSMGGENFAGEGGPTDWMSTRNPLRGYAGRGPRNYRRSDDRILEDINEQLTRHFLIDATDVEVLVVEGEVTLRGRVNQRDMKRMAEDVAESVSGVKHVKNELRVQPPAQRPDIKEGRAA